MRTGQHPRVPPPRAPPLRSSRRPPSALPSVVRVCDSEKTKRRAKSHRNGQSIPIAARPSPFRDEQFQTAQIAEGAEKNPAKHASRRSHASPRTPRFHRFVPSAPGRTFPHRLPFGAVCLFVGQPQRGRDSKAQGASPGSRRSNSRKPQPGRDSPIHRKVRRKVRGHPSQVGRRIDRRQSISRRGCDVTSIGPSCCAARNHGCPLACPPLLAPSNWRQ
jgi:hypothetical protein